MIRFGKSTKLVTGSDMISEGMSTIGNAIDLVLEGISHNNISITNIETSIKELEQQHSMLLATNEKANKFVTNLNKLFE